MQEGADEKRNQQVLWKGFWTADTIAQARIVESPGFGFHFVNATLICGGDDEISVARDVGGTCVSESGGDDFQGMCAWI